jgi:DNA-binding MarR family transcriptional regulator
MTTRIKGDATLGLAMPWQILREAYFLLRARWTDQLAVCDLSVSEYVVLELCAQSSARASEVASAVGITAAGGTDVIDRLETRQLVRRATDPRDRRAVRIQLTPAGRRLFQKAGAMKRATLLHLERAMTVREREALTSGLAALARALRKRPPRSTGGE